MLQRLFVAPYRPLCAGRHVRGGASAGGMGGLQSRRAVRIADVYMSLFKRLGRPCKAALPMVLASISIVSLAAAQHMTEYADDMVVVQFAPGVSFANKAARTGLQVFDLRASRYGVHQIERVYPFLDHVEPTPKTRRNLKALRRTYYVRYGDGTDAERVSDDLDAAPGVVYAEPVIVNRTQSPGAREQADPDDPGFGEQTYLRHLRLPEAWDEVRSEDAVPPVVIAIVDGGGQWRHEDLLANVWTNPDEIADNGIDDDDNGFVDDVHGVDFANEDDADNDPMGLPQTPDNIRHGTATAGAASAVTNNGVGIAGTAWNARIMHINAGCTDVDGNICFGYEGIVYAAANGADIINASFAGLAVDDARVSFMDQSLDLATDMGALVVAGAGNDAVSIDMHRYYPARHPRVLSVGATEKDGRRLAPFSNYGKLVNVFAPGMAILTTGSENAYASVHGTSFSSPLTAGVAALVKTRFPGMTPDAIREQVRLSSENMDAENPERAGQLGRGFVNALEAIRQPVLPGVRLGHWSWIDGDGDDMIASGNAVTVTATLVNHLADANNLKVGLVAAEAYPFVAITVAEVDVGRLASGDSTVVRFELALAEDAPAAQRVRFFVRIAEGALVDEVDTIILTINRSLEAVHRNLSALYSATGGDSWTRNDNWDITTVPSEQELANWYGIVLTEGALVELLLTENNLIGTLPGELGGLAQLTRLELWGNSLTGTIPPELGGLTQLRALTLNDNSFTGAVPPELGDLTQLKWLILHENSLTGTIPPKLGGLAQLEALILHDNSLTGTIPPELGSLEQLQALSLQGNSFTGTIPPEFGSLAQLQWLTVADNRLTGMLPRSLLQLNRLGSFHFGGQALCAPADDAFQAWLRDIPDTSGPTCTGLQFAGGTDDQTYTVNRPIASLVLPEVTGGEAPITYMLEPALPAGLAFDAFSRTLGGTPTEATPPASYVYSATDNAGASTSLKFTIEVVPSVSFGDMIADLTFVRARPIEPVVFPGAEGGAAPLAYALAPALPEGLTFDVASRILAGTPTVVTDGKKPYTYSATGANGSRDSLQFALEVLSSVAAEHESLPPTFAVHGNYPNPFRQYTHVLFDLPWPADVTVEVMDLTGRRVLSILLVGRAAGFRHSIPLSGRALPSGLYVYRLTAASPEGSFVHTGRFVRIR